jgi:hypothetical protein
MDSLEHPRRQAQHLDIKALTTSWIWPANVDLMYKGFKVYNQIAVPNTQKLAVCMECFESHSQNLGVSASAWEINIGPTGSNSSHLKSHLEHKNPDIFNRTEAASRVSHTVNVDEAQLEYFLIKMIAGLALPLSIVENELFRNFVRQANPTIPQYSRSFVRKKILEKRNDIMTCYKQFFRDKVVAATTDGWTSCKHNKY